MAKINERLHKSLRRVPLDVIEELSKRAWPGNVRELENVLIRAAVLSQGEVLAREAVLEPPPIAQSITPPPAPLALTSNGAPERVPTLDEVERDHIARVFALTKGHKGRTCELLGISRPTLERKLRKYGLSGIDES
jgi:two-component system response regulator AtoC